MVASPALKRVALSFAKAFVAGAGGYALAHEAEILSGGISGVKLAGFAAIVAGLDAAFKVVQIKSGA